MARVVFLGTPEASVPTLEALTGHHDVALVVTQPDRPKGRSKRLQPPPVKEAAQRLGIEVAQPGRKDEIQTALESFGPFDVGVVVAYGRILDAAVLGQPNHGMLNVHFSLLPRWRGAAPVERALMSGDPMTGVTIMKLDEGLDTGPVITAQAIDIGVEETAGELTNRLAALGARLMIDALELYLAGQIAPTPQSDEGMTYAAKITADDRPVDPTADPSQIVRQVRGLAPSPGATIEIDGSRHKLLAVRSSDAEVPEGTWLVQGDHPVFGTGSGAVEIVTLQPPGKNPMSGADWARGRSSDGGVVA